MKNSSYCFAQKREMVIDVEAKPAWKLLGARKMHRQALSVAASETRTMSCVSRTSSGDSVQSIDDPRVKGAVLSNRLAWTMLAHRHKQRMEISSSSKKDRNDRLPSTVEAVEIFSELKKDCDSSDARESGANLANLSGCDLNVDEQTVGVCALEKA
eukprot:CAMPEP_0181309212 /NCGR_PEP_ID=MMETSP1101-20121128/11893_1 /TAXON_ID=46948 /ORGANISM="Rhodomonas abbreviata, Strain Caron Lab Isolate" /LENGTH=155 /DNA_ID=CAMNT_0023415681 /DNA_START=118 /DNA_END=585 /DNA_ORIENTATION=+